MLEPFERWCLQYELVLSRNDDDAPNVYFSDIMPEIERLFKSQDLVRLYENETAATRLVGLEIDHDTQIALMLVSNADTNTSDPAFSNLETGELRIEPRLEGEGIAFSSHAAIDLTKDPNRGPRNLMVFEDVLSIGKTILTPFLQFLIREAGPYEYNASNGSLKNFNPHADLVGLSSRSFRDAMENGGALSEIELVDYRWPDAMDEHADFELKRFGVVLKPKSIATGNQAVDLVNRARDLAGKHDMQNVRVRWRYDKKRITSDFGMHRRDAGDVLVIQKEKITTKESRAQCEDQIRQDVKEKLIEMVLRLRDK